ncbi:hypothetical protein ACHAXA_004377 [Cyclostephanos tholiformis]|uniref:RNA polymerase sigma factor n=1 Tax=Cyclostephanos tholiformis TaxID=382380 RepID=A0ABD3R8W4_9STRA
MCKLCADALQSSPSFPPTSRHNNAHRYLDEGHPYTYDPNNFDIGSSTGLSDELRLNRPDGAHRTVQASIETSVSRDYAYHHDTSTQRDGTVGTSQLQWGTTPRRRRSKLAPHSLSSSILPTRRNERNSDLLTFDEEREIAGDIRKFRSVTRVRDNLAEWMSREVGWNQSSEASELQLASACSLTVDRLRDVITRGQEARTKLIRGNVGLVTMIAKRYYNMLKNGGMGRPAGGGAAGTDASLKLDDLIQEGYMGIMEAAERFDPTKGFRFSTYASHWIRQRIVRSIAESSRMIRLPVHVQTMIRNMHKKNKEMVAMTGRRPSMPELAHEMGVPLDKIHLYQHLSQNVLSLELPVDRHSNTEDKRTLGDRVACTQMATPDEDFMSESLRGEVHAMLDSLGHDERLVLTHRFGLVDGRPKSLRETAEGMGVSSDIVRTVEAKALNKLRQPGYRLKDYVGGSEGYGGGESDYAEPHNCWTRSTTIMTHYEDQQQHHHYHHLCQMNTSRLNGHDIARDDDYYLEEQERPTPESIWSF